MSFNVSTQVGSGTIPFVRGILPASQRGSQPDSEGIRTGAQVIVANPEDLNSVDAWAVSGVTVGSTTPVEIFGPNINPLPRCRTVRIINNTDSSTLYIGPTANVSKLIADGYILQRGVGAAAALEQGMVLPFLKNISIFALSSSGPIDVRILTY